MARAAIRLLETDCDVGMGRGNNLEFMRRLPDESMNLIVTSPPYALDKAYEKGTKRSAKDGSSKSILEQYVADQAAAIADTI